MINRRKITAFGIAGLALAFDVMQPSYFFTIPLMATTIFMIAYGTIPDDLRRWANGVGPVSGLLNGGLDRADRFFAQIAPDVPPEHSNFSELLSKSIASANRIQQEHSGDVLAMSAKHWIEDTRRLIEEAIGGAEAALFMSNAGMVSYSGAGAVRISLERRLQRLNDLIQRIDRISIKPDFDQNKWEQKFNGTR